MLRKTWLEKALAYQEGTLGKQGILCVRSGKHTARSPKGKYVVNHKDIDYNKYHQPISSQRFKQYWEQANQYLGSDRTFGEYQIGQHLRLNIHVAIETELQWHQYLSSLLFAPLSNTPLEKWSMRCCPGLEFNDNPVFIGISFEERKVLICGTGYGGEIKKAMFTVMNVLLPKHNVLPMHCSAVVSERQETSLLLGLSGTGKTTLSTSSNFTLIGDDENAWANDGIFNLENGSYAKVFNLSKDHEPQIFLALREPCIFENVIMHDQEPDFSDGSITENSRAAYPLSNLSHYHRGLADHPKNIIFLCCDLYGVMPALSKLTIDQALTHFMVGYTAKVGNTESGSQKPIMPVSSPCFGHPFFPLTLNTYAKLFQDKISRHQPNIWLVNTGWHGGDYQMGKRYPIQTTKMIIQSIIEHKVPDNLKSHPALDLQYVPKIQDISLDLPSDWVKSLPFKQGCNTLQSLFVERDLALQD